MPEGKPLNHKLSVDVAAEIPDTILEAFAEALRQLRDEPDSDGISNISVGVAINRALNSKTVPHMSGSVQHKFVRLLNEYAVLCLCEIKTNKTTTHDHIDDGY